MSGILLAALASLLTQQAMPHPSTQATYSAPAIRPFEPRSDFGREVAEGDADAPLHRAPLTAPVKVEAYARSYEYTPTDAEAAYEQGVASAEIRTDQTAGPLDGMWRIRDGANRDLGALMLLDSGVGPAEGGWRGSAGSGAATTDGLTLTLDGLGSVTLERNGDGWRGQLTHEGRTTPVSLSRPG